MRTVVVEATAPDWAQRMITDLNNVISELKKQIAALEKRIAALESA